MRKRKLLFRVTCILLILSRKRKLLFRVTCFLLILSMKRKLLFRVTCFLLILIRKRKLLFRVTGRGYCLDLTSRVTKLNYRITKSHLKYSIFTITAVFQITPSCHFKVEITSSHQQKLANHAITPTAGLPLKYVIIVMI